MIIKKKFIKLTNPIEGQFIYKKKKMFKLINCRHANL